MVAIQETGVLIPQRETTLVRLTDGDIPRLRQRESLHVPTMQAGFKYQCIAEEGEVRNPWPIHQNISPYNGNPDEINVLLIDTSGRRYAPYPHRVPLGEGIGVARTIGNILAFFEQEPGVRSAHAFCSVGPRAFGTQEYKGGYASLVSELHFNVWNYKTEPKMVPITDDSVSEGTRWAIQGDKYKQLVAERFMMPLIEKYGAQFIEPSSLRVDERGVVVTLKHAHLSDVFKDPDFFLFLQNFDTACDAAARDVAEATTDVEFEVLDREIKYAYKHGTNGIFPLLEVDPQLRSLEDRRERLEQLRKREYFSPDFVDRLIRLNPFLKNRDEVKDKSWWVRKWFAYAFVASENFQTGEVELRVSPGIFIGDRGGPVETMGIALKRREVAEATPEEIGQRRENLQRLKAYLAAA